MLVVYFDTSAGQAMICCCQRIMLWLGIGMMGLQLVPDTGETRERARKISRSCFPTRCYGYGYLAPPVYTVRRYKASMAQEEFEKYTAAGVRVGAG